MAGESNSGIGTPGHPPGAESRSTLKLVLKILFWFGVLSVTLIAAVGFYAYQQIKKYRANRERYAEIQEASRPAPSSPVDIVLETDDRFGNNFSSDPMAETDSPTMAPNNEAAPSDAPLEGPHASLREEVGIVINELYFHPPSDVENPEDTRLEFIELHNTGLSAIPMEGYEFTKGVSFTFPAFDLAPNGYVVIAADPDAFRRVHPNVENVLGGWEGRLSNSGENVELENADGEEVDSVRYSDSGEWATRVAGATGYNSFERRGAVIFQSNSVRRRMGSGGWEWQNNADGNGASLELRSAAVSNNQGRNWAPSTERGGTPGRQNSMYSPNIAPIITNARHSPVIPTPREETTITASIKDELKTGIEATLFWRANRTGTEAFKQLQMVADGSTFSAKIPPQSDQSVVEFFVRANDREGFTRTWPAATDLGQAANALFQVEERADEPAPGFALYRLVMTPRDNQNFQRMSRHTNAQANATLIADDGAGPIIRYNCGVRYRGAGSRDHYPTPLRVNVPGDNPWHGATRMNLNSKYSWLQFIGMKIFADAGERAPDMKPVAVRFNGDDLMGKGNHRSELKGNSETDYGYYVHAEPLGGEWVKRHYPYDDKGNCYKKVRPDTDWAYRGGSVRSYLRDGWSKTSNLSAADWSDLDHFLKVMNSSYGEDDWLTEVQSVADLEQWYRWLAISAILANGEGGLAKGVDDDYGLYRGEEDRRFRILPHDLDTILARGDRSRITDAYHTLFDFAERGEEIEPLEDLFDIDTVRNDYLAMVRMLTSTTFASDRFEPLLRNHLSGWVPEREIQRMVTWMNARRAYAESEVELALGSAKAPLQKPAAHSSFTTATNPAVRINEVLAAGENGSPDFVELHNASNAEVDLSGWRLSDNKKKPDKCIFPTGTVMAPDSYLVLNENDCGFRLEASGEGVFLFPPATNGESEVEEAAWSDSITFGLQVAGYSIGRTGSGEIWTLNQPSPGAENTVQPVAGPGTLRINEWLTQPTMKFDIDFIELYNTGTEPVAAGGLRITNDPYNDPNAYEAPPLSFIGGQSFTLFKAIGNDASKSDARQLPFKLPYEHGYIHVAGINGTRIDQVSYHCHRADISEGRRKDGNPLLTYFSDPTPGSSNTKPPTDHTDENKPLLTGLRISEIMFHPIGDADLEYIELANSSDRTINLKGVRFTQGIEFEFDDDFDLSPNACAVIAADAIAFGAEYGEEIPVAGEFKGKLSNGGETLQLKLPRPSDTLIVSIEYDDKWHLDADGLGKSLVLKNPKTPRSDCGNADAWKSSSEDGGSPGRME